MEKRKGPSWGAETTIKGQLGVWRLARKERLKRELNADSPMGHRMLILGGSNNINECDVRSMIWVMWQDACQISGTLKPFVTAHETVTKGKKT